MDKDLSLELQAQVIAAAEQDTPLRIIGGDSKAFYGGELIGEPDILFSFNNNDEGVYFSCECKLLNRTDRQGRWSSLAGEYIDEGVMRYINEQYSGGVNGGMIGYVIDGDITKAVNCINEAIEKRRENLGIEGKAELKKSHQEAEDALQGFEIGAREVEGRMEKRVQDIEGRISTFEKESTVLKRAVRFKEKVEEDIQQFSDIMLQLKEDKKDMFADFF